MTRASDWARSVVRLLAVFGDELASSGELDLAPFQEAAAGRLAEMMRTWGGALLADAVGLGKTRVCLTVAATIAREQRMAGARGTIWCCVPARLVEQWRQAAAAIGLRDDALEVVSHTSMSRGNAPKTRPLVVVIDEAHRFRNPKTRRRATLLEHADVPILLATATPIANSVWDLYWLLDLFVDDGDVRRRFGWDLRTAFSMAEEHAWDLTELIREVTVRRLTPPSTEGFGRRPTARLHVEEYVPSTEESWVWQNLEPELASLTLAAADGDWPRGLFVEHVLRRWESGPEALLETIAELVAFHERWLEAWRSGGSLDRQTFRTMFGDDVARQQVFGFLYTPTSRRRDAEPVRRDLARLTRLRERVEAVVETGSGRDEVVERLAREDRRLLIFTSYRRAARALFERLCSVLGPTARIGLLTGDEARATGLGRTTGAELIRRFAPRSSRAASLQDHQQLRLLVATDCIAEGTNLQDCGRIVLADLPYTPLGIEQRVGRLLRPGGPHDEVDVYLPRPRDWADSLGMRRRLNAKLTAAHDAGVGSDRDWFGAPAADVDPLAALTALDRLAARFEPTETPLVSGSVVEAPRRWLVVGQVVDDRPRDFCFVAEDGEVHYDMHAVVAELSELVWDSRTVTEADVPDVVERALRERQRFLRAARHAPTPLDLDAPEVRAWRLLCDHPSLLAEVEVSDLRRRLLRRHSAGVRRRLERFVELASETPERIAALLRYAAGLPTPPSANVTVRLIACLGLEGSTSG